MKTQVLAPTEKNLDLAAALIRAGRLVAFPTETVYGLGASATDAGAMAVIYGVKGRPGDNPLIVHVVSVGEASEFGLVGAEAGRLMDRFWPGALTLVLPRRDARGTVAVRSPDHPVARSLIERAKRPIAAPSANLSGRPSPTRADHVLKDLGGRIPLILDGGETGFGLESTVLDVTGARPKILRPGGVTQEDLAVAGFDVDGEKGEDDPRRPLSPGTKYRHYSPGVPVLVLKGEGDRLLSHLGRLITFLEARGKRVGLILFGKGNGMDRPHFLFATMDEMAKGLFAALRELEGEVDLILVGAPPETGIGRAVMNRLQKASDGHVYEAGGDLPPEILDL